MPSLDIISVNIWQILISLCNLVILFVILKKFLYQPVHAALQKRQDALNEQYQNAENAEKNALHNEALYTEKLNHAHDEADQIVKNAAVTAGRRGDEIVADAQDKARMILNQARNEALLEKKKSESQMKNQLACVSAALTEKLLHKKMDDQDQHQLIEGFLKEMDEDGRNQ